MSAAPPSSGDAAPGGAGAPRFAYLVLAHKNPEQLVLLCQTLTQRGAQVWVHIDAKLPLAPFEQALGPLQGVTVCTTRWPIYWGGFNMIRATLHMARQALAWGADRVVLLSGLDFPIQPMAQVEHTLGQDADFIEMLSLPCPGVGDGDGYHRIWYFCAMDLMGRLGLKPRTLFTLHRRLLPFWHRRVPQGLSLRLGSQWWSLRRQTLVDVLALLDQRPDIERFFKWSNIPDESFFQTLVQTVARGRIHPHNLRHIVWDRQPKPYVFQSHDLPELMQSQALFARKFDMTVDAAVLPELAARLRARPLAQA